MHRITQVSRLVTAAFRLTIVSLNSVLIATAAAAQGVPAEPSTVSDSVTRLAIGMWRVLETDGLATTGVAAFAPNGRAFAVVMRRGDLEHYATEATLLVAPVGVHDVIGTPRRVLTLRSTSNEPPIADVHWLDDNHTIAFLGDVGRAGRQVYTYDLRSRQLRQRTAHQTPVELYDISGDGAVVVYKARPTVDKSAREVSRMAGEIPLPQEPAWHFGTEDSLGLDEMIFAVGRSARPARRLYTSAFVPGARLTTSAGIRFLKISPDHQYAVFGDYFPRLLPRSWNAYTGSFVEMFRHTFGSVPPTYALLDLSRGNIEQLVDAPITAQARVISWAPAGASVIVNTYLPVDSANDASLKMAQSDSGGLVEVDVRAHTARLVAHGPWRVVAWHGAPVADSLLLARETSDVSPSAGPTMAMFVRRAGVWAQVNTILTPATPFFNSNSRVSSNGRLVVGVRETLVNPPELGVLHIQTGTHLALTNLNAPVHQVRFDAPELVHWRSSRGDEWSGHLVRPSHFESDQAYPTVIMIMDSRFNDQYAIDGREFRAAYPVQALAHRGFVVLMAYLPPAFWQVSLTPEERPLITSGVDAAVTYLSTLRFVDLGRLGLSGFSRSGWMTEYAVENGRHRFAAAVAIDNARFSYFEYLIQNQVYYWTIFDRVFGGLPYGESFENWRQHALGFNLEKVHTPLLLETHNKGYWSAWEDYAGLRRLGKPVELVRYPDGPHTLVRPAEQFSSAVRHVDWYCFWLKGEEDPNPAKAEQYARWRELRKLQQHTSLDTTAARSGTE